jgi:NAD+ synthase (glutamine-hydrolysing)
MKLIKVAAAVLNQTPRDWKGNKANILEAITKAKEEKVTVLCLPEATITGYGMEDDYFCGDVPHRAILKLKEIINTGVPFSGRMESMSEGLIFCVGLPIRFNNTLYNSVATVVNGTVVGFTCKQHLAGDGIHYEPRWFKPWPQGVVQTIDIPELGGTFPIGDIHFNIGGIKIGYEICEDAWVANRPGTVLATKGVDIYLNPSASHFSFNKLNTRKNFVVDGSRAFGATYVYANLVGNEAGRAIYDGGALIATGGSLVAIGKRFTHKNVLLTTAVVDVDNTRTSQVRTASFQPNIEQYNQGCVKVNFEYPTITEQLTVNPQQDAWELSKNIKHEECVRALGLALMDYMRKSHTKGFTISLSGGADSAMVTYLCATGIKLAVSELGVEKFVQKYCPYLAKLNLTKYSTEKMPDVLIKELITTAYQATAQSGRVTKHAASGLATNLGIPHFEFDVEPMVQDYRKLGAIVKGSELNFEEDDITLQNLQARVRAPGIWVIANMKGTLLLTTSNMSEAAVGYATMDGDTAGSVAPIAGLPKVYIREFLAWVAYDGPDGIGRTIAMGPVVNQQPTAELRPAKYKQTDEDDLMPYWLLHKIETMVVKNRYTPVEIYQSLKVAIDYDNNQLIKDITKFFNLFSRNQWKRERYALSFHMDDHNLDPRTWCRTPILTGGYEEELEELQKFIV